MITAITPSIEDFGLDVGPDEHIRWFDYDHDYTVEVGDNRFVLRFETDDIPASEHINDMDESCYGRVSEYAYDYWREGHTPRPDAFSGRARKVQVDRGYWMWWDPPATLWVPDPDDPDGPYREVKWEQAGDAATLLARQVRGLLEMGFIVVIVKRQERCSMGYWHTVDTDALGGVDKPHPEHIHDLIQEVSQ